MANLLCLKFLVLLQASHKLQASRRSKQTLAQHGRTEPDKPNGKDMSYTRSFCQQQINLWHFLQGKMRQIDIVHQYYHNTMISVTSDKRLRLVELSSMNKQSQHSLEMVAVNSRAEPRVSIQEIQNFVFQSLNY